VDLYVQLGAHRAGEKMNAAQSNPSLPPGPRGLPLIGNALQMGARDIPKILALRQALGDIVYMKLGPMNAFMLFNPDHVYQVLVKNQKNYVKGMGYDGLRLMLGQGLLTSEGETWLQDRRLMSPFFTPTTITRYTAMMVEVIQAMLARWQAAAVSGQPINMDEEMMRLTMSVIGRAMFSIDLAEEMAEVGRALREAFDFIPGRLSAGGLLPISFPLPSHRRFQRNLQVIDAFIHARVVAGRRQIAAGGPDGPQADNLLAILLKASDCETGYRLSEQQLRDEVATLFFAGFETTARSLTWGWYLLSKNPAAAALLAEEACRELGDGAPVDVARLKYSRMVVDETLRLYPPTAMLARQNIAEDNIGGYTIPAGSMVVLVPYGVHRYPGIWENPEVFDPERFGEQAAARPRQAYIPFASGPRVCLGNSFALLEMVLTFSLTAASFSLTPTVPGEIGAQFAGTVRPTRALWMKVEQRQVFKM
jgi:cytochrome P450